ncbi:MAG: hypothetical protein KY469_10880 [Actinobacteria bacterium]|nr:hypothetical protein [Actinomycetota bacterium]
MQQPDDVPTPRDARPLKRLVFGSNEFINTPAILLAGGEPQIFLEVREDRQLLLTADLYDEQGTHVARLRRNAWTFNPEDRYTITTSPSDLSLTDGATDQVVFHASVESRDEVVVDQGSFFTSGGDRITVEPDRLVIGGMTMMSSRFENCRAGIEIGQGFVGLGSG